MSNTESPKKLETSPQLVHEAEAQRQHIRINLPASAYIEGKNYQLSDWSVGGISLVLEKGENTPSYLQEGQTTQAHLQFQFDGFGITVPVKLSINSVRGNRVGCQFIEMDRNKRTVMQYLVTSYTSGELVNTGDLLDVVGRNNMTKPRNVPDPYAGLDATEIAKRKLLKSINIAAVAVLSALLVAYIVASVYQRLYVVGATSAQVHAEMLTVDAPAAGKLYYNPILPDMKVTKGAPLLTVSTTNGASYTVDSPCNCIVKKRLLDNNRIAKKGEPALELVRPDAKTYVEAYIAHKNAVKLSVGQEVMMAMPGHNDYQRGIISIIQSGKGMSGNSLVRIEPNNPLPVEYVDDPVEIRIDTKGLL
jgi:alginate biosynthesis protein Alg44